MDRRKALALMGIVGGVFIAKWGRTETTAENVS